MDEVQRFGRGAGVALIVSLFFVALAALLLGHGEIVSGVLAGGLVGFANLFLLVRMVRRVSGRRVTTGLLQVAGMLRLALMGGLLAAVLIWGRANPIGTVIGYGLFPLAAAVAGFWVFRRRARSLIEAIDVPGRS